MRRDPWVFLIHLMALLCLSASARATSEVEYRIDLSRVAGHLIQVEARIPAGEDQLELFLPVWTPGSYLVREYARNIEGLEAFDLETGALLSCRKSKKNRWLVESRRRPRIGVRYAVYSHDMSVRGNWADPDFALINGAQTYMTALNATKLPHRVRVSIPGEWSQACTALAGDLASGFLAKDYDELIDSPIVCGNPLVTSFELEGVAHELVTVLPPPGWNQERAASDVKKIVKAQKDFWGDFPYQRYVFLNLVTGGGGGLEHSASTVLMSSAARLATPAGYRSWLGLVSHEFFHTWNGKRLRPKGLGPFDYENECFTRSLWIVEGVTDYYAGLILARAGLSSESNMISELERRLTGLAATPGERVQSLSDSSFDAWIKYYRPDENSRNTGISYYSKGALVAWHLDITMRRLSEGRSSLDDLMRGARERFPNGYTDEEFEALAGELTGSNLSEFFEAAIRRAEPLDLQESLQWLGLELSQAEPPGASLGLELEERAGKVHLKMVLRGSAAYEAGLQVDDEVIAINGRRFVIAEWQEQKRSLKPGDPAELIIARRGKILQRKATLAAQPKVVRLGTILTEQRDWPELWEQRRSAWIHGEAPARIKPKPRLY